MRELDGFSHLWLIFGFHQVAGEGWSPTVRPPRLGGNRRVGVWASRSPFRPNGLGLSLVKLEGIGPGPVLNLAGLDLVDGSPVYDIKPYLPYCEHPADARGGFADARPDPLEVVVDEPVAGEFADLPERARSVILEALAWDPRPAAGAENGRVHGARMCGRDVRFRVEAGRCVLVGLEPCSASGLSEVPE